MIAGLAATLPTTLTSGLTAQGVPGVIAHRIASLPPVGSLFAAFLGYNPVRSLLTPTGVLSRLPARSVAVLTGKTFFPRLISQPFHHGLVIVFIMAIAVLVIAAAASAFRGGRYVHEEGAGAGVAAASIAAGAATSAAGTDIVADDFAADEASGEFTSDEAAADFAGDEESAAPDRESVRATDGRVPPGS
jgi:hypothetical protein